MQLNSARPCIHNDRVFNYIIEQYFSDWNPGGQMAFGEGME